VVLTITAGNQSVPYATAVSTVTGAGTYTPTGFVNSETSSVISGSVTYTTTYTNSTAAGTAGITITPVITGLTATNYSFSAANGTITITKADQSITLAATGTKIVGDADYTLAATSATSGINALSYLSSNPVVASINNTTGLVHIVAVGMTTITVSQGGNTNYNAAPNATQTLTVSPAPIVAWQFGNPASLGSEATYNATTNDTKLNTSILSRGSGITATTLQRGFAANNWDNSATKTSAVTNNEYFQFSINTKPGYKVSLSTLEANIRRARRHNPNSCTLDTRNYIKKF